MDDEVRDDRGYWHEYDIGAPGRLARALFHVLPFAGIGIAVAFAVVLFGGILGEEGLLPELTTPVDLLSRMSLTVIMVVAYAGFGVAAVADSLRVVATRRALRAAVAADGDPRAVPHPHQVETVVLRPHLLLLGFLGTTAVLALFLAMFGAVDGYPGVLAVSCLVLVTTAGASVLLWRDHPHAPRREIADHFTAHVEQTAWSRARRHDKADKADKADGAGRTDGARGSRLTGGPGLLALATMAGALSAFVLETYLYVRHPGTPRYSGAQLADRGEYSTAGETVLDLGLWVAVGLAALAIGLAAAGVVVERTASLAARRELTRLLDDPQASLPAKRLLARYAEPHAADVSRVAALLGGLLLVPATAVVILSRTDSDTFLDASLLFGPLRGPGLVGLGVAVLLLVAAVVVDIAVDARGLALRNRLTRRWPTRPKEPDKDSRRHEVRTRPSLRAGL